MLEGVLQRVLRAVFGGGSDISAVNPLPGELISRKVIPEGIGSRGELDRYWWSSVGGYPISNYWNHVNGRFEKPVGVAWGRLIYTRLAYDYPVFCGHIRWPTMAGWTIAGSHWFIIENGSSSAGLITGFVHVWRVGADVLTVTVGGTPYDITALAPADWMTAFHYYTIVKIINGAEFWIDDDLVAVYTSLEGLNTGSELINNVLYIRQLVRPANKNWVSCAMGMIGIEDAGIDEDVYFEVLHNWMDTGDPKLSRFYFILNVNIAAGATSPIASCAPILACTADKFAITVECTYNAAAVAGAKVHLRTSYDGNAYDTEDWDTWNLGFAAGATKRQTKLYEGGPRFVKVLVENLDQAQGIADVYVKATVGGA